MDIKIERKDGKVVIIVEGRLDTVTSVEFNDFIEQHKQELTSYNEDVVIMDCKELEYISSAGLRALLALKKLLNSMSKSLEVCNINNVIKEVFNVTGFVKMIKIN